MVNPWGPQQEMLRAAWNSGEKAMVADLIEPLRPELAERVRSAQAPLRRPMEQIRRMELHNQLEMALESHAEAWWTRALLDWDWEDGVVGRPEATLLGWQRYQSRPHGDIAPCFWNEGTIHLGQGEEAKAAEWIGQLPQWGSVNIKSTARINVGHFFHHLGSHRVHRLGLKGVEVESGAIKSLETTGRIADLQCLDLSFSPTVGDRALRDLAQLGAPDLCRLNLSSTNITRHGLSVLLGSSRLPNLRKFAVDLGEEAPHSNGSYEVCHALDHSSWLGHLEELALCGLRLEVHDWDELASLDIWDRLRSIRLAGSRPSRKLLKRILQNPHLEELDLGNNALNAGDILDIASLGKPPALKRLCLDKNPLGDQATLALAKLGWFADLKSLELRHTGLGRPGLVRIAREISTGIPELVGISGNHLGDVSLPAFFAEMGPCEKMDLGSLILDEPMAQLLRKHISDGIRTLVAGQPVPGLELASIWQDPGKLNGLQTLCLVGGMPSDAHEANDLRELLKRWPGQSLTRIVSPSGRLFRRRPKGIVVSDG